MNETFECGDTGALVAYLYEECEPEIRDVIASHLIGCESCSNEIDSLGWTRRRLQAWAPPEAELGFQIAVPLEARLPWWRAPLPAWAQAVAALVIFGVGLSVVKEWAERFGGTIDIEEPPGGGARFVCRLRAWDGQDGGDAWPRS